MPNPQIRKRTQVRHRVTGKVGTVVEFRNDETTGIVNTFDEATWLVVKTEGRFAGWMATSVDRVATASRSSAS